MTTAGKWAGKKMSSGTAAWLFLFLPFIFLTAYVVGYDSPWWNEQFIPALKYIIGGWIAAIPLAILGTRGGPQKMEVGHVLSFILFLFVAVPLLVYGGSKVVPKEWLETSTPIPRATQRVHPAFTAEGARMTAPTDQWSSCIPVPVGYRLLAWTKNPGVRDIALAAYYYDGTVEVYQNIVNAVTKQTKCVRFRSIVGSPVEVAYQYKRQ